MNKPWDVLKKYEQKPTIGLGKWKTDGGVQVAICYMQFGTGCQDKYADIAFGAQSACKFTTVSLRELSEFAAELADQLSEAMPDTDMSQKGNWKP